MTTESMRVKEVSAYIDISFSIEEVEQQLKQLVKEVAQINGTSKFVPQTVLIGRESLFDFLYIVSYEITRYGEIDTLYIKYMKVDT